MKSPQFLCAKNDIRLWDKVATGIPVLDLCKSCLGIQAASFYVEQVLFTLPCRVDEHWVSMPQEHL